jgi:hypothetical protein
MGKDMRGQRPSGEFYETLGEEHYGEGRTIFLLRTFFALEFR